MSKVGQNVAIGTHEIENLGRRGLKNRRAFKLRALAKQLYARGQRSIMMPAHEWNEMFA